MSYNKINSTRKIHYSYKRNDGVEDRKLLQLKTVQIYWLCELTEYNATSAAYGFSHQLIGAWVTISQRCHHVTQCQGQDQKYQDQDQH